MGKIEDKNFATYRRLKSDTNALEEKADRLERELSDTLIELEKHHHLLRPFQDYYEERPGWFNFNLNRL